MSTIDRIQLPDIRARGPRKESKPNLHVEFSAGLDKQDPALLIKRALLLNADIDCNAKIRFVKAKPATRKWRGFACEVDEQSQREEMELR